MYIVVTGGSGFLGSHVVEELVRRGHQVGVFDINPLPKGFLAGAGVRYIHGDLADIASVTCGLAGADAVCHLGGVGDVYLAAQKPHIAALLNVGGTAHVAEAALMHGVSKLVYASTWEVYGEPLYQPLDEEHPCNPDHPYNISKYAGELLALSYDRLKGLPVLALRLGTSYGARMRPNSVFSIFINKARRGETIVIQGTGEQSRQFTHASDIARAFAMACESEARGMALNIVAEESVSIRQLAEFVAKNLPTRIEHSAPRVGDVTPARVSSAKARAVLGWDARARFVDGLTDLIHRETVPV
ncbi:MAG: NAD-dependent epimerase/dehydratase family protein [Chloroflexota bacterium]